MSSVQSMESLGVGLYHENHLHYYLSGEQSEFERNPLLNDLIGGFRLKMSLCVLLWSGELWIVTPAW